MRILSLLTVSILSLGAALCLLGGLAPVAHAQSKPRTFAAPPPLPDNIGVLGVPTTHWLNTNRGIRLCTDKQGFFAGSLTSDHKRVDKCSRPYTLSQYVQLMAGRGAYATNVTRLAQGQLTIEYIIPLTR